MTLDGDIDIRDTNSFEYMLNNNLGEDQSDEDIPQSCLDILTDLNWPKNSIVFVTAKKHLGMAYHPDFQNGIRPGDIVVGLFGINFPFILRPVPGGIDRKPAYNMINVAYMANHKYGHEFVEKAPPKTSWRDLKEFGLQDYIII
ncbi:hypothetical protein N0V94_008292 [Neodidymelliopsis sp. IMI 364377]|nr:hypothetical protein N0V94_008292 [Neodidymelliopsis sp. IMI 364377]